MGETASPLTERSDLILVLLLLIFFSTDVSMLENPLQNMSKPQKFDQTFSKSVFKVFGFDSNMSVVVIYPSVRQIVKFCNAGQCLMLKKVSFNLKIWF